MPPSGVWTARLGFVLVEQHEQPGPCPPPALDALVEKSGLWAAFSLVAWALRLPASIIAMRGAARVALWMAVGGIWIAQLIWSPLWLSMFRMGPLEWLWRCLTYGRMIPLRK